MKTTERIIEYCQKLRLSHIRDHYTSEVDYAVKEKLSYQDFLVRLLEQQVGERADNAINRAIRAAGFPCVKRLEEFDFAFQPHLDEKQIRELASLRFMETAENVVFLGPPGVGKTHLAVALGINACQAGKKVRFLTNEEFIRELVIAEVAGMLHKKLEALVKPDLVIIDELGYTEMNKKTATLFFQLISKRYEKGSVIITSNKPFEEWGRIFQEDVIASAILDRILHHCHPFFIQGKSYRMKNMSDKRNKK